MHDACRRLWHVISTFVTTTTTMWWAYLKAEKNIKTGQKEMQEKTLHKIVYHGHMQRLNKHHIISTADFQHIMGITDERLKASDCAGRKGGWTLQREKRPHQDLQNNWRSNDGKSWEQRENDRDEQKKRATRNNQQEIWRSDDWNYWGQDAVLTTKQMQCQRGGGATERCRTTSID